MEGLEPLAELARFRIVQCQVDPAIARERRKAAADAGSGRFHVRIIGDEVEDWEEAFASFGRLSLAAPSIDVDTSHGYAPEIGRFSGSSTPASEGDVTRTGVTKSLGRCAA